MKFAVFWPVDMLVESTVGAMRGDVCLQAGGCFQPVIDVVTRRAAALLIEMIGVIADIVLGGRGIKGCWASGGLVSHRCCCFRHKESVAHV